MNNNKNKILNSNNNSSLISNDTKSDKTLKINNSESFSQNTSMQNSDDNKLSQDNSMQDTPMQDISMQDNDANITMGDEIILNINQQKNELDELSDNKIKENNKNENNTVVSNQDQTNNIILDNTTLKTTKDLSNKIIEPFNFKSGDIIKVHYKIIEGTKTRIQPYEGIVISKKGKEHSKTFTVRRIGADNVGVERIFPLFSPNIEKIEILKRGKVRRSKLYYLRNKLGRAAMKVKELGK